MPADDQGGARPPPVVLRIKLRYDDVETMVQRFAPNVGKSGLFLPTKSLQPIGTEIKFELRIANDTPVLVGLGRVKAVKPPDPANPRAAFGLAIELMRVTRDGREVIIRMIERRRAMGLADVAIPMPDDVETAKRADVETQPRAEVAAIVAPVPRDPDSAPILSAPPPVATPLARATPSLAPLKDTPIVPAKRASTPPESSFTSARPSSGSMPAVRSTDRPSAPALAPEPTRAKRPRLADVLAQAERSGPVAGVTEHPDLDQHVDLERAMSRARTLAGGDDLDAELSALRESAAAPLAEITIEAASAELARQLGGLSVSKRMRVPALGTVESTTVLPVVDEARLASASSQMAVAEPDEPTPVADEPPREYARPATSSSEMDELAAEAAAAIAASRGGAVVVIASPALPSEAPLQPLGEPEPELASELAPEPELAAIPEPVVEAPAPRMKTAPPAMLVEDDADLMSFERALEAARVHTGVATVAAPAADDDIAELDPDEIEELGESTQVGQHPDSDMGNAQPVALLADSLDRQLDDAEVDNAELARTIQEAANAYEAELAQVPEAQATEDFDEEEISDLDVLAEDDADAPAYVPAVDPYSHDHPASIDPPREPPATFAAENRAYAAAAYVDPAQPASDYGQDPVTYAADPNAYADYAALARGASYAEPAPVDDPYAIDTAYRERPAYAEPQAAYTAQDDRGYDSRGRAAAPDPASYEDPQRAYDPGYAEEAAYADQVALEAEHDADVVTRPGEVPLPPSLGGRVPRRAATPEDEDFDFAAQLDLDEPPAPYAGGYDSPSEYTLAEKLPTRAPSFAEHAFPETPGLEEALEFDEPHQFATNTPAPPMPRSPAGTRQRPPSHQRMASRAGSPHHEPAPDYRRAEDSIDFDEPHGFVAGGGGDESLDSLESALSTLDVDLDHLEVPPAQRTRQPRAERASDRGSRPLPGMPPEHSPLEPPTVKPTGDDKRPRTTGRNVVAKPVNKTVPKPAPAVKRPTAAPPVPKKPTPRAASEDDGVLIDFDDDD